MSTALWTDCESMGWTGSTERYPAGDDDVRRLSLEVPRVFADDNQALRYVELARREVVHRHARNRYVKRSHCVENTPAS